MKIQYIPLSLLAAALLLGACMIGEEQPGPRDTIVVVDKSLNRVLSAYETDSQDRVVRTTTYNTDGYIRQSRTFLYDQNGYLGQMDELVSGKAPRTVNYINEEILDEKGQVKTVRTTTSDGQVIESHFVYDNEGVLRGTARTFNDDTVIMKDYGENE